MITKYNLLSIKKFISQSISQSNPNAVVCICITGDTTPLFIRMCFRKRLVAHRSFTADSDRFKFFPSPSGVSALSLHFSCSFNNFVSRSLSQLKHLKGIFFIEPSRSSSKLPATNKIISFIFDYKNVIAFFISDLSDFSVRFSWIILILSFNLLFSFSK